jgi:DNA repair exonuclease SbcCD ATPase subunit
MYRNNTQPINNSFAAPGHFTVPANVMGMTTGSIPGLGAPVDRVDLDSSFTLTSPASAMLADQVSSRFGTIDRIAQSLTAEPSGRGQESFSQSNTEEQNNALKYTSAMDELQFGLAHAMPYDGEGSYLGMNAASWDTNRDATVKELEMAEKERNFAMEIMSQRLEQIEKEKVSLQQQVEETRALEREKRREAEQVQKDVHDLYRLESESIDHKINDVDNQISEKQSSVSGKEAQLSQLKDQLYDNPENSGEIQEKISNLESRIAAEKYEVNQKEEEKSRLELEKIEENRKADEDKNKKQEMESRVSILEDEIVSLEQEKKNYLDSMNTQDSNYNQLQDDFFRKQSEMAQLRWLISSFEYNTR